MGLERILLIILLTIILTNLSSALCKEGQIDINTASAEELDEIVYIGISRAEQIIFLRPFDSVDDMIRISGIGEVYLSAIKEQGLACISGEETREEIPEESVEETTKGVVEKYQETAETRKQETTPIELETISLNPKVIKSEDDMENLNKNNYAIYGFVFFSVLMAVLFIVRKNRYKKNEFG